MSASDALVVFGITGDLAKRMTLQSLYRLEATNSLDVPIVGVAGDDWTLDHLREHARESIEAAGYRLLGTPVKATVERKRSPFAFLNRPKAIRA